MVSAGITAQSVDARSEVKMVSAGITAQSVDARSEHHYCQNLLKRPTILSKSFVRYIKVLQ